MDQPENSKGMSSAEKQRAAQLTQASNTPGIDHSDRAAHISAAQGESSIKSEQHSDRERAEFFSPSVLIGLVIIVVIIFIILAIRSLV